MSAKLNLNLDNASGPGLINIYHSIYNHGQRFRISTGKSVKANDWDKDKQQVKRDRTNYKDFNQLLKKQQNDIERIILNLELHGKEITKPNIVMQLGWTNSIEIKDFKPLSLFSKYIEALTPDLSERTISGKNKTLKYLQEYEKKIESSLSFKDYNEDFYKKFRSFLGMPDNSFGFHIKNVKSFLNWANDKGFNEYLFYKKFKTTNEDGKDHFFLKSDEIEILANFNFENRLEKVRDLFLVGCYSGLRISDLKTLKPAHVQDGLITKIAKKTNDFVKIPIIPELQTLLDKYWKNNEPLPVISDQKGNEYLKELAKIAGLNRPFNYIQKTNKTATETMYEAWQKMSWHVARHSFITYSVQRGVTHDVVRRVVGHSNFNMLKKYIQNDDSYNKIEMMKISKNYING
jgi:integrase